MRLARALCALVAVTLAGNAFAQQAELRLSRGPYYAGTPIEVQIIAEGFAREPQPEVEVEVPEGVRLEQLDATPNVRSEIRIVNGRMTKHEEVKYSFRYRLIAPSPDDVRLGPFRVQQGGEEATTQSAMLRIQSVPESKEMALRLELPEEPVFPGQRVPVRLEWRFPAGLQDRLHRYSLRVPLFERTDLFRFADVEPKPGDTELRVDLPDGSLSLRAEIESRVEDGQPLHVVRAERTAVPLRSGTFEIEAPTVTIDEVTRWQRDLFGMRTPATLRKLRAGGTPQRVVVRDLPLEGRPVSFAGAIGRGFSLEASADRSVVQVGEPIELQLVLRGDGNLESAGPPRLSGPGGLPSEHFRVPEGDVTGAVEDGAKTFRMAVRPLDEEVDAVPPIAYAYFDPERAEYVTVRTRPIALSVRPASLVTARDVVRGEPAPGPPSREEEPGEATAAPTRFTLTGANLSIVRDPARLLAGRPRGGFGALEAVLYVVPLVLLLAAVLSRRRADRDPDEIARLRALGHERERIARAAEAPRAEALRELSHALRAMLRLAPGSRTRELDAVLAECDAQLFAPEGAGDGPLDPALHRRALALADRIREQHG